LFQSAGTQLVIGALLAGIVGYAFNRLQTKQAHDALREGWGAVFYDQVYTQGPRNDPIGTDPPTVRLLNYSAISHLLQPGVIDPQKDSALLNLLIFFDSVVQDYNYRAQIYNSAWATGVDRETLEKCKRDVYMSNMDYGENHSNVSNQLWQLYIPGEDTIYVRQQKIRRHYERMYADMEANESTPGPKLTSEDDGTIPENDGGDDEQPDD